MWKISPFLNKRQSASLAGCDESILANNAIRTLQHFRINSCDRTAWAKQNLLICFSCFRSRLSFCPTNKGASTDHSISVNIATICAIFLTHTFLATNNNTTAYLLLRQSLIDSIVRRCSNALFNRNIYTHFRFLFTLHHTQTHTHTHIHTHTQTYLARNYIWGHIYQDFTIKSYYNIYFVI
jgi:hypothetical protein